MGTPLPPNEPGNGNSICFGIGKPFGDTVTPKYIQLTLSNLLQGQFWSSSFEQNLLTPHTLIQGGPPGLYLLDDGVFTWQFNWPAATTQVQVANIALAKLAFSFFGSPSCQTELADDALGPIDRVAWGGFLSVTWSLEGL